MKSYNPDRFSLHLLLFIAALLVIAFLGGGKP